MTLGKCPICRKAATEKMKPFCSERCSMVDLGRWLGEGYRVEAPGDEDDEESLANSLENEGKQEPKL